MLFPASAGTFQPKTMTKHYLFTFPRKRGDEPASRIFSGPTSPCSPQAQALFSPKP